MANNKSTDVSVRTIDLLKGNRNINLGHSNMKFKQNKHEHDLSGMESDKYGLVDDIFFANEFNSSFQNSSDDSLPFSSSDDDLVGLMKSAVDERKPFESFEKQITITVPQPPPLKEADLMVGGLLFGGKYFSFFSFFFNLKFLISSVSVLS